MIRVDEAVSARPEARYSLGVYVTTLLLGSASALLGLNTAFPDLPLWVNGVVPATLGALLGIVFAARPALADSVRTLSHGEAIAAWLVCGALFACTSVIFGAWLPLAGLVALHVPAFLTLVTERGYARFYVLSGLTMALALADIRTPTPFALGLLAFFLLMLVLCMAYENFYFGLENAPAGAQVGISSWLPLRVALVRFAIAGAVTAPLAWLTPVPDVQPEEPRPDFQVNPRSRARLDMDFTLFEAFLYTMALVLMLLLLGALMRWIRARRRRKREGLEPESIGMPVGGLQPLEASEDRPPPVDPKTPLGQIVRSYEQFSRGAARRGCARRPSATPQEFREALKASSAVPEQAVEAITLRFETARYAPEEPTEQHAKEFRMLVEDTLARLTGPAATED